MSVQSKMTAIADATRALDGSTAKLTLDGIASKLGVEKTNVEAALAALVEKEVDVPAGSTSAALAELIASIEAGGGEIAYGTLTPSEDTIIGKYEAYLFEHNCGFVPDLFYAFGGNVKKTYTFKGGTLRKTNLSDTDGVVGGSFNFYYGVTTNAIASIWDGNTPSTHFNTGNYNEHTVPFLQGSHAVDITVPAGSVYEWVAIKF